MLLCGKHIPFLLERKAHYYYAPERYCLCADCTDRVGEEFGWIKNNDKVFWTQKDESADLL